jgi:hypothetical protein
VGEGGGKGGERGLLGVRGVEEGEGEEESCGDVGKHVGSGEFVL